MSSANYHIQQITSGEDVTGKMKMATTRSGRSCNWARRMENEKTTGLTKREEKRILVAE